MLENDKIAVAVRPALPQDEGFLYDLYATTRPEIASFGLSPEMAESVFRMQFNAQRQSYRMQFPNAEHNIILCNDAEVGRLMVDRTGQAIHLVDISLMPEHRARGVGGYLIRQLISEASESGRVVALSVLKENPARRLYERLGFTTVGESDFYYAMEYRG